MASTGWKTLKREVELLRKQFLPDAFDPLGQYAHSACVQAHTRAYLVLSHAEIETYLEAWAKAIARAAEVVWNSSAKVTEPLVCLLHVLSERTAVEALVNKDITQQLADNAKKVFAAYYKYIKDNNGIKERNIVSLLGAVGVPPSAFGSTLLATLDTFGSLRGEHAHHSSTAVLSVLDPETEFNRVRGLVVDLEPVDKWLLAYRRRIR